MPKIVLDEPPPQQPTLIFRLDNPLTMLKQPRIISDTLQLMTCLAPSASSRSRSFDLPPASSTKVFDSTGQAAK